MSNVRISNGSPPLERMEGRLTEHPKPSACTVLFGVPDREELRRELKGHLQLIEETNSARWNFDFASYRPLPSGRYEWEAVDEKDMPEFYSRPHRTPKSVFSPGNKSVDLNGNHDCTTDGPCHGSAESSLSEITESPEDQVDSKDQFRLQRKRPASHAESACQNKRCLTGSDEDSQGSVSTRKTNPKTQTT